MGRLLFGSLPINDAGKVPAAVPTKVPSRDVLLQGPLPADLRIGLFFSNSTASSSECVSICSFLSNMCFWERFTFHLLCERCQSPLTDKTPCRSQTHRRLKTNMGSWAETGVTSKRDEWRKSRLVREFGVGYELDSSRFGSDESMRTRFTLTSVLAT